MGEFSEDALREAISQYEAGKRAALEQRDARLRSFHEAGWRPVDLQRVTGYSRETIRQALHPEVRRAANTSRRKTSTVRDGPPTDYVPYGERKSYVVAATLDELRGPTRGTVTLPHHLDWSGDPRYDLDRPARLATMYKTVLLEANSTDDLCAWLDGPTLVRCWRSLWLPQRLRRLWEDRFPELAATGAEAA